METRRYAVVLTGASPLLMHADNLAWREIMKAWENDPANKRASVAGEDRSPAWRWLGGVYHDGGKVAIPSDNLMTVLREGGKQVPTGKRQGTFKSQTQSGLLVNEIAWPVAVAGGRTVPWPDLESLVGVADFAVHEAKARELGFELFAKPARVGKAKHIRVRARFDAWSCAGTITVLDERITREVLGQILEYAGAYAGLGDWRPSSPQSPGPFGRFTAAITGA